MNKATSPKSLKDQNGRQLWIIIAANMVFFFAVFRSNGFSHLDVRTLFTGTTNLLPVGLTIVITSVVNGLLSAEMKARLVFLRWTYALPGHRAFSYYTGLDPRIDVNGLKKVLAKKWPSTPRDENRIWYKFSKELEDEPAVDHVHREFLLTRDYTGVAALFVIAFGPVTFFLIGSWKVALVYGLLLVLQFVFARHSAATYGARFVCTVLALKTAKLPV